MSTEASGLDGAIEGIRTSDFDDVVDAGAVGLILGPGGPVWVFVVIEGGVCAEFFEAGGFCF